MRVSIICGLLVSSTLGCGGDDKKEPPSGPSTPPPTAWKAAVGDHGTLVETFDDASWTMRRITDTDLRAVSCVNNEVGWAVGVKGFIGHTRDGGWSWPAQASGLSETLHAVSFAFDSDENELGLAVGEAGTVVTTRDGGQAWTRASVGVSGTLRGTAVTEGATIMLAVGDDGLVARSETYGRTFSTFHVAGAGNLFDVALDASGGLALAVDDRGSIWISRDAAKTFELEHDAGVSLESVSLGRTGALASASGAGGLGLLRSSAGVWSKLPTGVAVPLHATLVGPHEDRAYFAGDAGTLLETLDDGATVFAVKADTSAALRGIEDLEQR